MTNVIVQLKEKKEKLQEIKDTISRLSGKKEQLLSQLKKDFKIETLVEADKKLISLHKELEEHEKNLEKINEEAESILKTTETSEGTVG